MRRCDRATGPQSVWYNSAMNPRVAYGLLGLTFLLLIGGAWYARQEVQPEGSGSGANSITSATTTNATSSDTMLNTFSLTSPAFKNNESIPSKYTCDGQQSSVPLEIHNPPAGTKSFTLIMHDPDVPTVIKDDGIFWHWVMFNIPGTKTVIVENQHAGSMGLNSSGKTSYVAPCPPSKYAPPEHRYVFTLYALDTELQLPEGSSREEVEQAMAGHVLAQTKLVGHYKRQ